jgi:putative transposase
MTDITIRQGFKYRLRPKAGQAALLRRYAGCCRYVWNAALAEQQARYARGEKFVGFAGMCKWLTAWKQDPERSFLKEPPVHALQSTLKDLDEAFRRFFRKEGGYPKFKRYGDRMSFSEPDVKLFAVDEANNRVRLPKLGWMRYRKSRELAGSARNLTVSCDALGWHVSIQTERSENPASSATAIGAADRGITNFLATADGGLVSPLNAHRQALRRLRRYQRNCARKVEAQKKVVGIVSPVPKGIRLPVSNRLAKARARLARYSAKIARQRQDFLHKLSHVLAERHAAFVLEDLRVKNMSRSAKGDAVTPGTNVRQKAGLNRSILDQGWSEFARQLRYKLEWRGGQLVLINPRNTSRTCHCCGYTDEKNRHGEQFRCLACGHQDHADINAAKNILAAGHAVLAGNGHADVEDTAQSGRPMKRQPVLEVKHVARS